MDKLQVICPVIRAKININSELIDDIGQFTKFILWAIGKGYQLNEINQVIELGDYVILEEVNYLCKIGFILENNNTYSLNERGYSYLNLIDTIENVNSLDLNVHINCFSGEVQEFNEHNYAKDSINEDIQKLPDIVLKQFFYNKNYANSRDFIFNNYPELFQNLNVAQKDSIYIQIDSKKETKYVIYELSEVPNADFDFSKNFNISPTLLLQRTIQTFNYILKDERLEKYRNVLSTLSMIEKFDEELLSTKSLNIISWEEAEKKINRGNTEVCVDMFTGDIINFATNNYVKQRKAVIRLPEYQIDNISDEIIREKLNIDNNLIISEPTIEKTQVYQLIPFNLFFEKGYIDEE